MLVCLLSQYTHVGSFCHESIKSQASKIRLSKFSLKLVSEQISWADVDKYCSDRALQGDSASIGPFSAANSILFKMKNKAFVHVRDKELSSSEESDSGRFSVTSSLTAEAARRSPLLHDDNCFSAHHTFRRLLASSTFAVCSLTPGCRLLPSPPRIRFSDESELSPDSQLCYYCDCWHRPEMCPDLCLRRP